MSKKPKAVTTWSSGTRGRPSRKEEGEITEAILEVATRLFLTSGYEATSMNRIGKEAKVAANTLYARFSNKAELFSAVVTAKVEVWKVNKPVPRHAQGATLQDVLEACALNMLEAGSQDDVAAFGRLLGGEGKTFPELTRIYGETAMKVGEAETLDQMINASDASLTREDAAHLHKTLKECVVGHASLMVFDENGNSAAELPGIARRMAKMLAHGWTRSEGAKAPAIEPNSAPAGQG